MPKRKKKWNRLYSYEAEIFGFIKEAVGNAEIARDLFQDVYLQAILHLDRLDSERSLKNWLKTVARNRVINYFRENKRRRYEDLQETTLTTEISGDDTSRLIGKAMHLLPPAHREALRLREIEGMSYDEMSRELKISASAVTSLLSRARAGLKRQMILQALPDWFVKRAADFDLDDLGRFINSFDHGVNLLTMADKSHQIFFSRVRADWNRWRDLFIGEEQMRILETALGKQAEKRLLDIGCGSGMLVTRFRRQGALVTALDLNKNMLLSTRIAAGGKDDLPLLILQGNARWLPFKNKSFETIIMMLVLHHLADPGGAIAEAATMLRKNGKLVIMDFLRHRNRPLADQMHDLWLGFRPTAVKRWLRESNLVIDKEMQWQSPAQIEVFMYILSRKK